MENEKIEKIKELVNELNNASNCYYNGDRPIMTDVEWDNGFDELKLLENESGIIYSNSPTQKVGYEVKNNLEKVTHVKKMLSLDKTKDIKQLEKFIGNNDGDLSWKEDGLTIVLTYENQELTDAVTRGNGEIGSRILHNAKVFKAGIPLKINYKGRLVIRGEGLISKKDFELINVNDEYANPRNLASGSIMSLDNKTAKQRMLQFKAFSIAECDKEFETYSNQLDWLRELGFNTVEYKKVNKSNLTEAIEYFKNNIESYEFMTDGLVLMMDNLKYGESLGFTNHHNLSAQAFKWSDSTQETILRSIQFQVGRTGVLTPVANFDEVELEGSMVSKASLHNLSILRGLEMGIGDIIEVYKANMIIPQVLDNQTRSNTFEIPTHCHSCGSELEIKETDNAEFLMCNNPNCGAKLTQKISHYCSKNAMNIMGVSDAIIDKFIEEGIINNIVDLYKIENKKKQIITLEGFGLKSYNNFITSLNTSKKCKMANFLFALGIPNVGLETSKDLAKAFKDNFSEFFQSVMKGFNFTRLNDIGEVTNDSLINWFSNDDNVNIVNELLEFIIFEKEEIKPIVEAEDNPFKDAHVYCTGKFQLKKEQLKLELEKLGAVYETGYKKSLDMLILGGDISKSGKADKAQADGVKMVSEDFLMQYIK